MDPGEERDDDGLPLARAPTRDDVRGDTEPHRRLAVGCSLVTLALVALFWLLRGWLGR
jgi:hypothetical protein